MRLQIDTFEITDPSVITPLKTATTKQQKQQNTNDTINTKIELQTEFYPENKDWWKHLCSSYCRIQLFRLKGAQRKLKTDRLKIERLNPPDLKKRYQTSESVTILYNSAFDSLYSLLPFDRNELSQLQSSHRRQQQLHQQQALTTNQNDLFDQNFDSMKSTSYFTNQTPPSFCCDNDLTTTTTNQIISNNSTLNESLQFYVENNSFTFNENSGSKFNLIKELMVDDITAIIDEVSDNEHLLSLSNRLQNKTKTEPDNLFSLVSSSTSTKPLLPSSVSLPNDLSMLGTTNKINICPATPTTDLSTTKQVYSTQVVAVKNTTARLSLQPAIKIAPNSALINDETSKYVQQWLTANRFSNLLPIFKNYTSNDFLRLSKDDLIKLCGAPDAIRCYNLAHNIQICPRLTMFVKFNEQDYFYAVYLNDCKFKCLIKRLVYFYNNQKPQQNIMIGTDISASQVVSNGIMLDSNQYSIDPCENYELFLKFKGVLIKMTDEVLTNVHDETKFLVEFVRKGKVFTTDCCYQNNNNKNLMLFENSECDFKMKNNDQTMISIVMIPFD